MDYEKAYKEILERAKYYQKENGSAVISAIFPELKESEDEKIRKALIDGFIVMGCGRSDTTFSDHNIPIVDIIAWLVKQKFIKKELGDIKGYREKAIKMLDEMEKQGEPKWSEEDETICNYIIEVTKYLTISAYNIEKWLKSIKKRMEG